MKLPCLKTTFEPLQDCLAECSRWASINEGQPILYYHDTSGWDPNCYTIPTSSVALDEPDPQAYLQPAIDIWESGYPCGKLFERTYDINEAVLIVQYQTGDGTVSGDALCFCDADDDVCVRQVNQSQFFTTTNKSILNIYCNGYPDVGGGYGSVNAFINLYTHELGHVLGMGHVRNQDPPVVSVLGRPANQNGDLVLYDFDRNELQRRYPCNCNLTAPLVSQFVSDVTPNVTSNFCPTCQGK